MRTASDVYHRLIHDDTLDVRSDAVIGYLDRFRGCMEVGLMKFETGGEIPQHRILYFRVGSMFLWHKETRLDAVFHSTTYEDAMSAHNVALREADFDQAQKNRLEDEEARRLKAWVPRQSRPPRATFADLTRVPVHRVCNLSESWIALDSLAARRTEECGSCAGGVVQVEQRDTGLLHISTLNVLHDTYLPESIQKLTEARWRAIVDAVCSQNPHFFVLTEGSAKFIAYLLSDDRIKERFSASDGPVGGFQTLPKAKAAAGQIVLIRRDVAVTSIHFTKTAKVTGKQLVFVTAVLPCGTSVSLAAVHLTSGQIGDTESASTTEKRRHQLDYVMGRLASLEDCDGLPCSIRVVAGDFNFREGDERACRSILTGFIEGDESLNTYDPRRNSLAALNPSRSDGLRLDRIYAMDAGKDSGRECMELAIADHRLFLTQPIFEPQVHEGRNSLEGILSGGLFASDHFGVAISFSFGKQQNPRRGWSAQTALVVMPDVSSRIEIDEWMRRENDPASSKWEAHVNLLYPFVAPDLIEEFAQSFHDAHLLKSIQSPSKVRVDFRAVSSFKHKSSTTVYLEVDSSDKRLQCIQSLAREVAGKVAGEQGEDYDERSSGTWTPHLTIAKLKNSEFDAGSYLGKTQLQFEERKGKWDFTTSSLHVLQRVRGKMTLVHTIKLRRLAQQWSPTKKTLHICKSLVRSVFHGRNDFEMTCVGSAALVRGKGSSHVSDIDLVLVPPPKYSTMTAEQFAKRVDEEMLWSEDSLVRVAGEALHPVITIDFKCSHELLPVDIMFGKTDFSQQAIDDTTAMVAQVENVLHSSSMTAERFAETLLAIKEWAEAKMLTQRGYTLFAGVSWSILLLAATKEARDTRCVLSTLEDMLTYFFNYFADFNFNQNAVTTSGIVGRNSLGSLGCGEASKDGALVMTPGGINANRAVSRAVVAVVQNEMRAALEALREDRWDEYRAEVTDDLSQVYPNRVVISIVVPAGRSSVPALEGWLRGRFAHFANQELGERGIAVRPSSRLRVVPQTGSPAVTCIFTSGVCEEWTEAPNFNWASLVAHAGRTLNDRFLRWESRPPTMSSLRVALVTPTATRWPSDSLGTSWEF